MADSSHPLWAVTALAIRAERSHDNSCGRSEEGDDHQHKRRSSTGSSVANWEFFSYHVLRTEEIKSNSDHKMPKGVEIKEEQEKQQMSERTGEREQIKEEYIEVQIFENEEQLVVKEEKTSTLFTPVNQEIPHDLPRVKWVIETKEELEPVQTKDPEPLKIKIEPEPVKIKKDLEPVKLEDSCSDQDEEQFVLKQETDRIVITHFNKQNDYGTETNKNLLLSANHLNNENQHQQGGDQNDSGSSKDDRDNVDNPALKRPTKDLTFHRTVRGASRESPKQATNRHRAQTQSKVLWRKCAFGCQNYRSLFTIPKEQPNRQKWLEFLSGIPHIPSYSKFVCDGHFTDCCFMNLGQYQSGLSERLCLAAGSIPTIKTTEMAGGGTSQEPPSHTGCHAPPLITPYVKSIGVQTTDLTSVYTRTVSTQLSQGTLKLHHVRSKAAQAAPTTVEKSTETQQHWLDMLSAPVKTSTSGLGHRPSKRPRLEEEEQEDKMEAVDISNAKLPKDSTYKPGASTKATSTTAASIREVSEEIDEEPTALEDTKYIVFESSLREIFDTCPVCKQPCNVNRRKYGTLVSFTQKCPHCQYSREWQSGPITGSTPVGNLQLSAAVYFSGGSFTKVAKICKAMNLQIHQHNTFRRHCELYLEPAIFHKWTLDQKLVFEDLKKRGKVALCGNMREDSTGHSAKFGTYTLMDTQSEKVVDMKLVQSNEVGGRYHMEKEGLHRSLNFLEDNGLEIDCIVTDRHPQIQKYLRQRNVTHYYDVGHVVKGLSKKLDKISEDKECQVVKKWLASIKNHMYWTAYSSTSGPEKVAKWTSLINHIQDVHTHDDPLFPKCTHPDKVSRNPNKWFNPGTMALYKVEKLMMNRRVLADVAKLSSHHQTSSLESFHSLIPRFNLKISDSKYMGMMCRHFLAAMHQNENAGRTRAVSKGKSLFKTSYPNYKEGQGTPKPMKIKPTYGYVSALMHLVFDEVFPKPSMFVAQLKSAEFERASKEQVHKHAETTYSNLQDLETPGGSREPHMPE